MVGHDDDEEDENENSDNKEIDYFAENQKLLDEMDAKDPLKEENQDKKGKPKKEKKKKEKKEKEKKEKKPKKPVDPELQEKVKVSPKVGFLLFSIIVVCTVAVVAGGNVLSYQQRLKDATDYYVGKDYSSAYDIVSTTKLRKTDEEFYQQLRLIMHVYRQYESYVNFKEIGIEEKALDALIKGVGYYELYKEQGKDYNVLEEMQYSLDLIKEELQSGYGVTDTEARELFLIEDRNLYSEQIYEIVDYR